MKPREMDGAFVVLDLDNEEALGFFETEEEARAEADRAQHLIVPKSRHISFATYRLELI